MSRASTLTFPAFETLEEIRTNTDPLPEFTTDTPVMQEYERLESLVNRYLPPWHFYSLDSINRTGRISPVLVEITKRYLLKRFELQESLARFYDTGVPGVPKPGTPEELALYLFTQRTDEMLDEFQEIGCMSDETTLETLRSANAIVCHDVPLFS